MCHRKIAASQQSPDADDYDRKEELSIRSAQPSNHTRTDQKARKPQKYGRPASKTPQPR